MKLKDSLKANILVLDGAMGTMLQKLGDNSDATVSKIHRMYIEAGADIISTNTFTANEGSDIRNVNLRYASLAIDEARKCDKRNIYVAGSIGPTNKTLTMSDDITFDEMSASYEIQIQALKDAGVDAFLFETCFDTLNLKAALCAAHRVDKEMPLMISATIDKNGRLLSGQTLEAFVVAVTPFTPLSIGLNCSFGANDMFPYLKNLSELTDAYISAYPNAGLPNELGQYEQTAEIMIEQMRPYFESNILNIVGGCCGTTPEHIRLIADMAHNNVPRIPQNQARLTRLSGLEPLTIEHFTNIGERTNVAGSKKFARLIAENKYEEALLVARKQVDGGASIIDVCMDDSMLDAKTCMAKFLHLLGADPYIAKVPIMIDSSKWEVLEEGLKHVQGKSIINSISLKEGEEVFLSHATHIKNSGAAVVVMAFDEEGQASTYERRISVCKRAYDLLVQKAGFKPEDIIFDPNVLSIATGLPEHDSYAVDFIRTVEYIKKNLPYAKVSGGISNLSFSFRGNNKVREAMHSVFLYHAINAGMDMAIVNPEMLEVYDNIPKELLDKVEAVVMNTHPNATDELITYASSFQNDNTKKEEMTDAWRILSVEERLEYALINGTTEYVESDINEALNTYPPLEVIESILMKGITKVGTYFGEGKMFLPQVVKSAQVMKKAVSYIMPHIEKDDAKTIRKKIVIATVRGDVHDIGKNIVSVVLSCNGYDIIDLGVMVPKELIIKSAIENNASMVCLSGLITPSLHEMEEVAKEMQINKLNIPLIIGGATTSEEHTAYYVDPLYEGAVVHSKDASTNVSIASKLLNDDNYKASIKVKYSELRDKIKNKQTKSVSKAVNIDWTTEKVYVPTFVGKNVLTDYPIDEIIPYINWTAFCAAWKVKGEHAESLIEEAECFLNANIIAIKANAVVAISPVKKENESIEINEYKFNFVRKDEVCLTDFLSPNLDYVGLFAATINVTDLLETLKKSGDDYKAMMLQLLADRLVEAFSELLHTKMKDEWWGFKNGIRPAIGYPSLPDHSMKREFFELLDVTNSIGVTLTETNAMQPVSSVCGFYFACDKAKYF